MNTRPGVLAAALIAAAAAPASSRAGPDLIGEYNAEVDLIPGKRRAWPLYAQASALLEHVGRHDALGKLPNEHDDWASYARWLKSPEVEQILRLASEASRRPSLGMRLSDQLPTDLIDARKELGLEVEPAAAPDPNPLLLDVLVPHYAEVRTCSQLLWSRAILDLQEGRQADAAERFSDAIGTARHAATPPFLIASILHDAIIALTCEAIEFALSEGLRLDPEQLADLQAQLEAIDLTGGLDTQWEINAVLQVIRRMYDDTDSLVPRPAERFRSLVGGDLFESSGMSEAQLKAHADSPPTHFEEYVFTFVIMYAVGNYSSQPPWERAFPTPDQGLNAELEQRLADPGPDEPPYPIVFAALRSKYDRYMYARVIAWTRVNATVLVLALHRHHARHDAFPQSLDEIDRDLLPEPPIDPYTGKPLLYKLTDDGPLVYSAGADRDDDDARPFRNDAGEVIAPRWVPASRIDTIMEHNPASIDGDWVLYPPTN